MERAKLDYTCFTQTGPDTLAGRFMRRFWHPVYVGKELDPGRAVPVRILGEDFTLYRGQSGSPHLVSFRCAHRGTQLSTGWVEGDCIRCRYHGWKYDELGQCVEQPGEEEGFASKVRIRSYPTEEYLGLIFVYIGDGEAPPLPKYPDFEIEGALRIASGHLRLYNFFQNLENAVDPAHVQFAHRQTNFDLRGGVVGTPKVTAEESDWGITMRAERTGGKVRVTQIGFPAVSTIKGNPDESGSGWRDMLVWRVPRDDEQHYTFTVNMIGLKGEAARQYQERSTSELGNVREPPYELANKVLRGETRIEDMDGYPALVPLQDQVTQLGQGIIADRQNERLGRTDVGVILLRKLWARELQAFAEGRPLKQWKRTENIRPTGGGLDSYQSA